MADGALTIFYNNKTLNNLVVIFAEQVCIWIILSKFHLDQVPKQY